MTFCCIRCLSTAHSCSSLRLFEQRKEDKQLTLDLYKSFHSSPFGMLDLIRPPIKRKWSRSSPPQTQAAQARLLSYLRASKLPNIWREVPAFYEMAIVVLTQSWRWSYLGASCLSDENVQERKIASERGTGGNSIAGDWYQPTIRRVPWYMDTWFPSLFMSSSWEWWRLRHKLHKLDMLFV